MVSKKRTREEAMAWARSLIDPGEPSVLAWLPLEASEGEAAAQVLVGALSSSRVKAVAAHLDRLAALQLQERGQARVPRRASSRG
jgi:hypothetical protein